MPTKQVKDHLILELLSWHSRAHRIRGFPVDRYFVRPIY